MSLFLCLTGSLRLASCASRNSRTSLPMNATIRSAAPKPMITTPESNPTKVWERIEQPTSQQRQAGYRLVYTRSLVAKLNRDTAALAIEQGIKLQKEIRGEVPKD